MTNSVNTTSSSLIKDFITTSIEESIEQCQSEETQQKMYTAVKTGIGEGNDSLQFALNVVEYKVLEVLEDCVRHCNKEAIDIHDECAEAKYVLQAIRFFKTLQEKYAFPRKAKDSTIRLEELSQYYQDAQAKHDENMLHLAPTMWEAEGSQMSYMAKIVYVYDLLKTCVEEPDDATMLYHFERFLAKLDALQGETYNKGVLSGIGILDIGNTQRSVSLCREIVMAYREAIEVGLQAAKADIRPLIKHSILYLFSEGEDFPYFAKGISPKEKGEVMAALEGLAYASKTEVEACLNYYIEQKLVDFKDDSNATIYRTLEKYINLKVGTFNNVKLTKTKYKRGL